MPEDRDQLFEKALARHMRGGPSACLDPETLAAYHERMLSPEELASAKSHIVSCPRCQELLAHLESSEEIAELRENADAVRAATVMASAAPRSVRLSENSSDLAAPDKLVALPRKTYFSLRWAAPAGAIAAGLLIWIGLRESRVPVISPAPAAQVAGDHRQSSPSSDAENQKQLVIPRELETRKSEAARSASADDRLKNPSLPLSPGLRDEKENSASEEFAFSEAKPTPTREYSRKLPAPSRVGPGAAAGQAQATDAIEQRGDLAIAGRTTEQFKANANSPAPPDLGKAELQKVQPVPAAKSAVAGGAAQPAAPPASKRVAGRLRGMVTDPSGGAISGASVVLKSPDGGTVALTSTDTSGMYFFSGIAAGDYQLELQSAGFKTGMLTGLNIAAGENVMNAKLELGRPTETVEVARQSAVISSGPPVAELAAAPKLKDRAVQALVLASSGMQTIASPDGKAVWKFGEMGQILHSKNAGKDWTSEASGVTVKLLAASAPSAKVCWVAGASGTLLRTIDGGKHWQRITVPLTVDLGGVHASDANHASIWDVPNGLSYETADGGNTWKQTADQ